MHDPKVTKVISSAPAAPAPRRSRRRLAFAVGLLLLSWALLEAATFLLYPLLTRRPLAMGAIQRERIRLAGAAFETGRYLPEPGLRQDLDAGTFAEVLHPYLGFVQDPQRTSGLSAFGLHDMPPLMPPATNALIIGIFGGSFADQLTASARQTIIDILREDDRYRGRDIQVLSMALNGYKQPQPLIALSYFLALGAQFDVVIEVDGFNEVALPAAENVPQGVFPFYPRDWFSRLHLYPDAEDVLRVAELARLSQRQRALAARFSSGLWRRSPIANVIWLQIHARLQHDLAAREQELHQWQQRHEQAPGYVVTGPPLTFANPADLAVVLAEFWARCSRQMHQLCAANGITYLHILQPNQYVPGSKPMSADERRVAILDESPFRPGAIAGYPHLVRRGADLARLGVPFLDLSLLFQDVPDPLYRDNCCHLNDQGYAITATAIARFLLEQP